MNNYIDLKNNIIIFLFSISIFFSHTNLYFIELRFIYLISILFIFFDKNFYIKINYKIIKIIFVVFIFLILHFFLNFFLTFEKVSFQIDIRKSFPFKELSQICVISISLFIIYFYKEILIESVKKLFNIFVILFVSLILIYNFLNQNILLDVLYNCNLGFFYYSKFIFLENSHFAVIAVPVILNFLYNIKYYCKHKILFIFNILFIIFAYGSFSLTFYLASLFSFLLLTIFFKNLEKYKLILLIFFLLLSNLFFFYGKQINNFLNINKDYCFDNSLNIQKKLNIDQVDLFKGRILDPKEKLFKDNFSKDKFVNMSRGNFSKDKFLNMSMGIQIYSFYVAKEAVIKNPFGHGINNYKRFREKIDSTLKTEKVLSKSHNGKGDYWIDKIIFEESYMPNISNVVLNFNLNSGSNNLSKILVEFGFFGIILLLFFIFIILSPKINTEIKFSLYPIIFSQLFIRGTGYFNSGFLIISIVLLFIFIDNIYKNEK